MLQSSAAVVEHPAETAAEEVLAEKTKKRLAAIGYSLKQLLAGGNQAGKRMLLQQSTQVMLAFATNKDGLQQSRIGLRWREPPDELLTGNT
jgi:hypothetical protein